MNFPTDIAKEEFARDFASLMHRFQKYGDKSYVYHLEQVVKKLDRPIGDPARVVAWLHDIREDVKIEGIGSMLHDVFGEMINFAVIDLTHYSDQTYDEYINEIKVCRNPIVREVKIADLKANIEECEKHSWKKKNPYANLLKKYKKALKILEE